MISGKLPVKRLYLVDDYIREISAEVIGVKKLNSSDYIIKLDKTIFYPGGGHQPCDKGMLLFHDTVYKVNEVEKKGDDILHHAKLVKGEEIINPGDIVTLKVDWNRRYHIMRLHTAEHIFMHFMRQKGFELEGGSWGPEEGLIVFESEVPIDVLIETEEATNEIIMSKLPVIRIIKNDISVIRIEGLGERKCGGTHVSNTGEIGLFKITSIERKGKVIRYNVGEKALSYVTRSFGKLMGISSKYLDLKQEINVDMTIAKIQEIIANMKKLREEIEVLENIIVSLIPKSSETEIQIGKRKLKFLYLDLADLHISPKYLKGLSKKLQEVCENRLFLIKISPSDIVFILERSKRLYSDFRKRLTEIISDLDFGKDVRISSISGGLVISSSQEKTERIIKELMKIF